MNIAQYKITKLLALLVIVGVFLSTIFTAAFATPVQAAIKFPYSTLVGQVLGAFDTNTQSPKGVVDGVNSGNSGFVDGWAYDPDYSDQNVGVHLYIDGTFVSSATANQSRSDVNAAFGISGQHGYRLEIPSQYRDGRSHTATVYALDLTYGPAGTALAHSTLGGTNTSFTWGTAATVTPGNTTPVTIGGTVPPTTGPVIPGPTPIETPFVGPVLNPSSANRLPIGYVNPVTTGGMVHGWVVDPDVPSQSLTVKIYVDGRSSSNLVATVQAAIQDDNLNYFLNNTTLNGITGNHAFRYQLPSRWNDSNQHTVYVVAQDANTYASAGNTRLLPEANTEREGVVFTWSDKTDGGALAIFTPRNGETLKIKSSYNIGVSNPSRVTKYYLKGLDGFLVGTLDIQSPTYSTDRACLNLTTDSIGGNCSSVDAVWNVGGYHAFSNTGASSNVRSEVSYAAAGCGYEIVAGNDTPNVTLGHSGSFCLSNTETSIAVPDVFIFSTPTSGETLTENQNYTVRFTRAANNSGKKYTLYLENNVCPQSTVPGLTIACTAVYRAPTELGSISNNQSSLTFRIPSWSLTSSQYVTTHVFIKEEGSDTVAARSSSFKVVADGVSTIPVDLPQACILLSHTMVIGSSDQNTDGDVTRLQQYLYQIGFLSVAPTGYYGSLTAAAVSRFQQQHNLVVGGSVGPNTMAALNAEICSGTTTVLPPITGGTDKYNSPLTVNSDDHVIVMQFEPWFGPDALHFEVDPSNPQGVRTVTPWYNSTNMTIGYDSADPNIIEQQVKLIEDAGANAILVDLSNGIACTFGDGTRYCGDNASQVKESFTAIKDNVAAVYKKVHEMSVAKQTAIKIIPLIGAQRDVPGDNDFAPQADGKAPMQKATDFFLNLYAQYPELAVIYEGKPLFTYYHGAPQGEPGTNAYWERTNNMLVGYQNRITKRNVGGFFDHQSNQRVSTNQVSAIKSGRSFWTWIDRYNQSAGYYPSYQPNNSGGVEAFTAAFASPGRCDQPGFEGMCWGSRALLPTMGYPSDVTLANNGAAFRSYMEVAESLKPTFLLIHQWNQYGTGDQGFDANTRTDIEPNDLIQYGNYNVLKSELAQYRRVVGN